MSNELSNLNKATEELAVELMKRDFNTAARESAAKSGAAMPDGSFPILTKQDLVNAVHAIGRANNPDAVKAHIRKRAAALGLSDFLKQHAPSFV